MRGSRLVYETSTIVTPHQWYVGRLEGARITSERQLTNGTGGKGRPGSP